VNRPLAPHPPPVDEALELVVRLHLVPHPEGGWYRETYRSESMVPGARPGTARAASTAILFLLPAGGHSAFHRIAADELWHHHAGDALELHLIDPAGRHEVRRLGPNVAAGETPQQRVPAGWWQAATPLGGRFTLCGCTVAPGFDFEDFELAERTTFVAAHPGLRDVIARFTRGS